MVQIFIEQIKEPTLCTASDMRACNACRDTGRPKTGYAATLPQVPPVLREYMTTHVDHFRQPYPQMPVSILCSKTNRHSSTWTGYI